MRFSVNHVTHFTYSKPVFLEPFIIRLHPRDDPAQRLLNFDLQIQPSPDVSSESIDVEGNTVTNAWFSGTTSELIIRSTFEVETLRSNPFDYLLGAGADQVPVAYSDTELAGLEPYLAADAAAMGYAATTDEETIAFLTRLTARINGGFTQIIRDEGDTWEPAYTIEQGTGSCRDLSWLFVHACRCSGVAARFVSGYQAGDPDQTERHLHAWAEVFLPGAGWRGWDPLLGLAVADEHIAVAAGAIPAVAAPTSGTYRGDATSSLVTDITLTVS